MSDTFITLSIPTSLLPDQGKDGCQLIKAVTPRLVVIIDTMEWIAYGVNADTDPAIATFLFETKIDNLQDFLSGVITGDMVVCASPQANGTASNGPLQYSLEIGGNKPPPPGPRMNEDAAFKLAIAIGSDSAAVRIAGAASLSVKPKLPGDPGKKGKMV